MKEVRSKLNRPGVTLIDSRESKRYLGVEETIVKAAGTFREHGMSSGRSR